MRIITLSCRKGYKLLLFVSSISHNDPNAVQQSPVLGARHCFSSRYRHLLHFLNLCTTAPLFQLKFSRHRISTTAPHFGEKKISAIFEPYFLKKVSSITFLLVLSPGLRLLFHVSCLTSLVSLLLSPVCCLLSPASCLLSLVSCLWFPISCIMAYVSHLLSHKSCLLSHLSSMYCTTCRSTSSITGSRCQSPFHY